MVGIVTSGVKAHSAKQRLEGRRLAEMYSTWRRETTWRRVRGVPVNPCRPVVPARRAGTQGYSVIVLAVPGAFL
jgi:hypothetical protein